MRKMYLFSNKTEKNRKKPVETEERELTNLSERLKVNCGTVLRTRMNIDDFALKNLMRFTEYLCRLGERARESILKRKKE